MLGSGVETPLVWARIAALLSKRKQPPERTGVYHAISGPFSASKEHTQWQAFLPTGYGNTSMPSVNCKLL